jgi:hypothetical protein
MIFSLDPKEKEFIQRKGSFQTLITGHTYNLKKANVDKIMPDIVPENNVNMDE